MYEASMRFVKVLGLVALAALVSMSVTGRGAAETQALTSKLEKIYLTAFDEALNRHASRQRDGTTYVSTGDIEAEWLRDASAVMEPYIGEASEDDRIREALRGVVAREAKYILIDPYANAFSSDYKVVERKFEMDSVFQNQRVSAGIDARYSFNLLCQGARRRGTRFQTWRGRSAGGRSERSQGLRGPCAHLLQVSIYQGQDCAARERGSRGR